MPVVKAQEASRHLVSEPHKRTLCFLHSPGASFSRFPELNITILTSIIYPHGGRTGRHSHSVDELMYIVAGTGVFIEDGSGGVEVSAGDLLYAPANVPHECINDGDETLKLFCVYIPALPAEVVRDIVSDRERTIPLGRNDG